MLGNRWESWTTYHCPRRKDRYRKRKIASHDTRIAKQAEEIKELQDFKTESQASQMPLYIRELLVAHVKRVMEVNKGDSAFKKDDKKTSDKEDDHSTP